MKVGAVLRRAKDGGLEGDIIIRFGRLGGSCFGRGRGWGLSVSTPISIPIPIFTILACAGELEALDL